MLSGSGDDAMGYSGIIAWNHRGDIYAA